MNIYRSFIVKEKSLHLSSFAHAVSSAKKCLFIFSPLGEVMIKTKVQLISLQLQAESSATFSVVHCMLYVFVSVTLLEYTSLNSSNISLL